MLTFQLGGFSPESLKSNLTKSNAYEAVAEKISQLEFEEEGGDSSDQMANMIGPFLKSQFSASYIKQKTEGLIDDTSLWLNDKTQNPPVVSFTEVKTAMVKSNPQILDQLKNLSEEMKKEQKNMQTEGGEEMDAETRKSLNELSKMDFDKFLNSDFSFPVGEKLTGFKQSYKTLKFAFPILIILDAVILGVIVLLSSPLSAKLRWVGITLLVTAIYSIIPYLIAMFLGKTPLTTIFQSANTEAFSQAFITLGDSLIKVFAAKYQSLQLTSIVILIIAGAGSLIASKFISEPATKPNPTKKSSK